MVEHDEELVKRHEGHFEKLFGYSDDFRSNYVRAPTFVLTIVTTVIAIAGLTGWMFTIIFGGIDKNSQNIFELAKKQVEIEQRQNGLQRDQDRTIVQLIDTLKDAENRKN